MKPRHWHYWISLLLSIVLIPVLRGLRIPAKFNWIALGTAYWLVLAAQSIFVAAALCLIGLPAQAMLRPLVERYRREPIRVVSHATLLRCSGLGIHMDEGAGSDRRYRRRTRIPGRKTYELRQAAAAILLPALYLFAGFLLVFAYNDIIASVHFSFACDAAFNGMDMWILHGWSISDLSHWAVRTLPAPFFHFLEFIYFGMFPQIGAAMILVTLYDGENRALQFVGTILTSYYLALGLFYLWPSQGPYYLCPGHFSLFPSTLQAYSIQKLLITRALALWNHVPIHSISTDYFIAFPCMHIAQPLIVMWFLRRWKRMLIVLCAYDSLLIVSILLLEWHYLVDIIGGMLVAGIAIAIIGSSAATISSNRSSSKSFTADEISACKSTGRAWDWPSAKP
jgi:hypothetical protein